MTHDSIKSVTRTTTESEDVRQLALEFANTLVSDRPGRDLLSSEDQLWSWIDGRAALLGPAMQDPQRFADYRRLRASIRGLLSAAATKQPLQDGHLAVVNADAAAAASWPELRVGDDGRPAVVGRYAAENSNARTLALIAESAIRLVGGPDRGRLGLCDGPGCRRFFLAAHAGRRWCDSSICGNRVRVARWARRRRIGEETGINPHHPATV